MVVSVARDKEPTPQRKSLAAAFRELRERFLDLAAEDERAFADVMAALRVPRDASGRLERVQSVLERAADVPPRCGASVAVLEHLTGRSPRLRAPSSDIGSRRTSPRGRRSCCSTSPSTCGSRTSPRASNATPLVAQCRGDRPREVIGRVDARVARPA
jgi:hypothetical protein